jgi:hypothetical protein
MDPHFNSSPAAALQIWQSRQRADGNLLTALVVVGVLVTARFVYSPGVDSAFVMAIVFVAVGMGCMRLLNSAARVVQIHDYFRPQLTQQIVDVEVLDVYEHPIGLNAPIIQTTSAYWLPGARGQEFDRQPAFVPQSLQISQGAYGDARKRGLK